MGNTIFIGNSSVLREYPWLLSLLLACTALPAHVHFNPCHDEYYPSSPSRTITHRSSWQGQGDIVFMDKVLADLYKTTEITEEIIRQLEDDFENTAHVRDLQSRGEIDTLIWDPLADLPFGKQLENIYASLRRVELFATHIRELLTSNDSHNSRKRVITTMLTRLGQGSGSGGGIYQLMCEIYNRIRIVEPIIDISTMIPRSLQGTKQLADIQDDFYHILYNTQKLLNELTTHMRQISDTRSNE